MSLIDNAKGPLTKKVGPLPVIAWAGIAIGALLVYKLLRGGGGGASSGTVDAFDSGGAADPGGTGGSGGGGAPSGSGGTVDDPTPDPVPPVPSPIPLPIGILPIPPVQGAPTYRPLPVVKPDAHRRPPVKAPIHIAAKKVPVKHSAPGKPKIVARVKPKIVKKPVIKMPVRPRIGTAKKAAKVVLPKPTATYSSGHYTLT